MRKRIFPLSALALLLIAQLAYAAPACNTGGLPDLTTNIGLALMALAISADVIAIGYLLSKVFPHLGLRNWVQSEYWEFAKSMLIVAAIYSILVFLSNLSLVINPNILQPAPTNSLNCNLFGLIQVANAYLGDVNTYMQGSWLMIGDMYMGVGFMRQMAVGYWLPVPVPLPIETGGFGFTFGATYGVFQNLMLDTGYFIVGVYQSILNDFIQLILFPASVMVAGQLFLLPAVVSIGLSFFIPVGLIFRAFPFIRAVGGTLIAMGIGFALIYPAVLVLLNYPLTTVLTNTVPMPIWDSTTFKAHNPTCDFTAVGGGTAFGQLLGYAADIICTLGLDSLKLVLGPSGANASLNAAIASTFAGAVFGPITYFMNIMLNYGLYVIIQLVLFILDLLIVYSITDDIANTLGGTIRLQLGGKIKLA